MISVTLYLSMCSFTNLHNLSSWPEKAHSDPVLLQLLGHANSCVCMGAICHSNHTCPQEQQHPELVGKRTWFRISEVVKRKTQLRCDFFFFVEGEGEPFRAFLNKKLLQISKDVSSCPTVWPLIAPFVYFHHYIAWSLCEVKIPHATDSPCSWVAMDPNLTVNVHTDGRFIILEDQWVHLVCGKS